MSDSAIGTNTRLEILLHAVRFSRVWGSSFDKSRQCLHKGSFIISLHVSDLNSKNVHLEGLEITDTYFRYL